MSVSGAIVIVGGTAGIGLELARHYAEADREVVLTGRDPDRAASVAAEVGGKTTGIALDLAEPERIASDLASVGDVAYLALVGIDRDDNTFRDYSIERARRLVNLKLVGYSEVVHSLLPRMSEESSVLMFGGLAKDRPYPGSATVSTINGGVVGMVQAMAVELAPLRVNAIHPAIVGDSPFWKDKPPEVLEGFRSRTPTGRLVEMADVVDAAVFLLENRSMNAANLNIDGGWLVM